MNRTRVFNRVSYLLAGAVILVLVVGVLHAFSRGGKDFAVFYEAWRLVLDGRGADIYRVSPDRYLYSPGFAWILAPLGLLPFQSALGLWCVAKVLALAAMMKELAKLWGNKGNIPTWIGVLAGALFITRPLLIDLEYGQVNTFILVTCVWALCGHCDPKISKQDLFRWGLVAFVAAGKLFPLPILTVPWLAAKGISAKKLRYERIGIMAGFSLAIGASLLSLGGEGTHQLLLDWFRALMDRGLPLESHNQSFTALLFHYLSGFPTPVISEGGAPFLFGTPWLSSGSIKMISVAWMLGTLGFTLGWITAGPRKASAAWIAVTVGLLIIPSHLIWKPYFVMSLPLAIVLAQETLNRDLWKPGLGLFFVLFAGVNLTGFDFVGHHWAPHFEAASILLLMHLVLILAVILVARKSTI